MEVEAKLATRRRATLDAIGARRVLGDYRLRAVAARDLETIYLDTPRKDLLRASIALRLRRTRGGVELTLKRSGTTDGVVHSRPETTWSLRRMPRLPLALKSRELRRELAGVTGGRPLVPLVGTRIRRRAILVVRRGGSAPVAEIACDEVKYFQPGRREAPASRGDDYEVEVELLGGEKKDLRAIVRALRTRYALVPSSASKLERALEWAGIRAPRRRSAK